jgi:hypothetical protein
MTIPNFLLGFLIASLYGALFHLIRGGRAGRLAFYLIVSWIGFWIGHFAGVSAGWPIISLGPLALGSATIFTFAFLIIGGWLYREEQNQTETNLKE